MKLKPILFAAAVFASTAATAQSTILYKKAFGGTWYDYASEVKSTPDSGMILIGTTYSNNGDISWNYNSVDAFVVKLDASGAIDWKRVYGGTGYDGGSSICPTADGGYIMAGISQSNDWDVPTTNSTTDNNFWILKMDGAGVVQWKKAFGGSSWDYPQGIFQLSDGSYIVGGTTRSNDGDVTLNKGLDDCWLIKLDTAGNLQWQKTYGGTDYDMMSQLIVTNDGGFAFTALTASNDGDVTGNHGGYDVWMVKTDVAGTIQWTRCYGGTGYEFSNGLMQTPTGEYVFIADRASKDGDGAFTDTTDIGGCWVVKISNAGNLLWENEYGGTVNETTAALSMDTAGRYVIASSSNSNDGNVTGHHGPLNKKDYWVFCLDTAGTLAWQRSFGGTDDEDACDIFLLHDGNLAVLGNTYSNNNGDVLNSGYHFGQETINPPNSSSYTVNTGDYWVIKITSPSTVNTSIDENVAGVTMAVMPNPATGSVTFTAENITEIWISDMTGRKVFSEPVGGNAAGKTIDLEGWTPGVYLVHVRTGTGMATGKLVVSGR